MDGPYEENEGTQNNMTSPPPTYPPPQPPTFQSPMVGESSKVHSALDLLNWAKILALIVGIIAFLAAAWEGISFVIWHGWFASLIWAVYYVIAGVVNFIIYMKVPEYDSMIRSRRYGEAKNDMLPWAIIGIIFGFLAGLFLILVVFLYLEELERIAMYGQQPQQYQYPPPPPQP